MIRVLATVVVRNAPPEENGFLYDIDWTHKRVMNRLRIPSPSLEDQGPRGGARGARGVISVNDHHIVANFNTLFLYSDTWELDREISHPLFNGLHEIDADDEGIWVSSTGLDAVVRVDWEGTLLESHFLGALDPAIRERLGIAERVIDPAIDHRGIVYANDELVTHVNSVRLYDGRPYVCLNKQGSVITLDTMEAVFEPTGQRGFHNGARVSQDLVLANSSREQKLYGFDATTGESRFSLDWLHERGAATSSLDHLVSSIFEAAPSLDGSSRPGWTRGLAMLDNGHVLIGLSPATILELDLESRIIVDACALSEDIHEAIHGLHVVRS